MGRFPSQGVPSVQAAPWAEIVCALNGTNITPNMHQTVNFPGAITANGFDLSVTSPPLVVPPDTTFVQTFSADINGVDTTDDSFGPCSADAWITNLAGTEVLNVACSPITLPQVGPDQSASFDWTTATVTAVTGTDLTWDGPSTTVASTAGGIFVVMLTSTGVYS